MERKNNSLEKKFQEINDKLSNQIQFFLDDIQNIFPETGRSSLRWTVSKMVKEGYLKRIRNGVYAVNEIRGKKAVFLSKLAKDIKTILNEEGFDYYISGMDVIIKFMQHVPENYPIILFGEKVAVKEITNTLKYHGMTIVEPKRFKETYEDNLYKTNDPIIILYSTDNFTYSEDNIATTEKAFIDLFYAITRNQYPLALQELARAYSNMIRLGAIDQKAMVRAAYKRNIQYDIRYIVESKYISKGAIEFVRNLR